ncbi:YbaB/EbfC family nucleoid-associated protein [Anaerococcus vaginalis]|uniref:Nucleoid-associated protein HMPREF0078_0901 n=2 Tax=Anaerococcus vaginalis TaxID=33037 RepID=C7HUF0_9FIRM|nr:YbaB/EbfC family nucleoid-associated protein [Anaerococcus vaginalis]EEU12718.1 DNA-binding protein, YbaB/EbfC family [Anaerococcus vaginalis ATCC 51170]MDU5559203.1 YbaB/EbfC family nucleoid-associated protein [Anaerococcus vaginalis]QQB61273.1 YbaB/EbfC family nucleoid-associated protein [Anaerococcus vaginalis]
MARGGFPGGGNMNSMMKKVQKMQQEMARTQQEIEEKEFSSTAGGGVIEAVVNGKKEVLKIKIDEDVVDPDDTEMLEDLVVAAINDALKKADEYSQKEMGKLTGNINIPGLM